MIKQYPSRTTEARRKEALYRKYKISVEDYHKLYVFQNKVCAICKQKETSKNKTGKTNPLCVDHCHKTNKIRGLLCTKCNQGLGYFNDDPLTLMEAIAYLRTTVIL